MAKTLIEALIDSVPTKKRFWTKGKAVAAVSVMSQLIAFAVTKRPALAPLQSALNTLLAPSGDAPNEPRDVSPLLAQIRTLRSKMGVATKEEQARLQAQVDILVELAVENT